MSKEEKAPYTSLLEDKEKTNIGSLDLFDRVINIKLTVSSKDLQGNEKPLQEYVIRSDYEMYFSELLPSVASSDFESFKGMKTCQIRKCQYKPDIKVQYKRVSMSTPVAIDIFINNFYMFDKTGKMIKNFNNSTYALTKVELAMGYFGQFEKTLKPTKLSTVTVNSLFDFSEQNLKGQGITLITMSDVEYVQTDKLPPDMTIHIHGYVGNLYSTKLQNLVVEKGLPSNYNEIIAKETIIDTSKKTKDTKTIIGQTFYECVTKNWCREGSLPAKTNIELTNSANYTVKGTLSDSDAQKYGVKVYFSKRAKEFADDFDKRKVMKDKNGKEVPQKFTVPIASTAMEKANLVKNVFEMKDYCLTVIPSDGNLFLYHKDEVKNVGEMTKGTEYETFLKNSAVSLYWKDKIPAVYNITTDALCTILCPFFFFLNPFQKFYFKTRYALGGLVSYYANFNATEDEFYTLWQTVSFATVEEINECTIICTGKKKE